MDQDRETGARAHWRFSFFLTRCAPLLVTALIAAACSAGAGGSPSADATAMQSPSGPSAASGNPTSGPAAGALVATIEVATPRDVMAAFGSIWVSNGPSKSVMRIDPVTNTVLATIITDAPASVLGNGNGAVWLTSYPGNSLTRIDPTTNTVTASASLSAAGNGPVGVTFSDGYVWVADHDGQPTTSIAKIDPATMKIVNVIPVGQAADAGPEWVAAGAGSIWTDVPNLKAVVRIDPKTDKIVATVPVVGGACAMVAASDTAIWAAGGGGDGCGLGIFHIDPATNQVVGTADPADAIGPVAVDAGGLWFGAPSGGYLGRIDPTSTTDDRLQLPGTPFGMTVGFGDVWITDTDAGKLYRVRPA